MNRWTAGMLALSLAVASAACVDDDGVFLVDGEPAPVLNFDARYFEGAVHLSWELSPDWDGEFFRVYGKRASDSGFFVIADVTNCTGGLCAYTDANVASNQTYDYTVTAIDPDTDVESAAAPDVSVFVPDAVAPPVPGDPFAVTLDNAIFLIWDDVARNDDDFSFYRIYVEDGSELFLLGETDSEGFLDLLAQNGVTSSYRVSSVDDQGHESAVSVSAEGTPRPDFHGELIFAHQDQPGVAGFRFQDSEDTDPILDGNDLDRHFRLEADAGGWQLVPGPGTEIHASGFETTTLKCSVAADVGCASLEVAPQSGYTTAPVDMLAETTYPMSVVGDDGQVHFGAVRVSLLGTDQNGDRIMIFDWAYQLQAGNPNLTTAGPVVKPGG